MSVRSVSVVLRALLVQLHDLRVLPCQGSSWSRWGRDGFPWSGRSTEWSARSVIGLSSPSTLLCPEVFSNDL